MRGKALLEFLSGQLKRKCFQLVLVDKKERLYRRMGLFVRIRSRSPIEGAIGVISLLRFFSFLSREK